MKAPLTMLSITLLTTTLTARAADVGAAPPAPPPEQKDALMKWWRDARFGMFVHFGLYAIPAGEWDGRQTGGGEWIMNHARIPLKDYEKLKDQFNPAKFDAKQWVKIARDAGMKYLVVTSKHHDGFCLWDTKVGDYDVMSTPFKRDLLRELADACRADGTVRLCFYYSIMDWHHPDAQSIGEPNYNPGKDYKPNPHFVRYLNDYMKPQLKELITGYDPGVLWFDGEWIPEYTEAMGQDVYNYCKSLKPDLIVNNRVGKSRKGMEGLSQSKESAGDFGTPEQQIPATGLPGVDWESCMTMNNSWGFMKHDQKWKPAQTLVQNLVDVVSKGGNYLLNVGPTADGEIPEPSVQRLAEIGKWMAANGESIHGAKASPFPKRPTWGRVTAKGNKLYLHAFTWPADGAIDLPMTNKINAAYLLADRGKTFQTATADDRARITGLPAQPPDPTDTVIVAEITGAPQVTQPRVRQAADGSLTLLALDADIRGTRAKVEKKGQNPHNIGYWTSATDTAHWNAELKKGGQFTVHLEYSLAPNSKGSEIAIEIGQTTFPVKLEPGKDFLDFKTVEIGKVDLESGPVAFTVRATAKPGLAVMDLRQIVLKPATR